MANPRRVIEHVWWIGCGNWNGLTGTLSAAGSSNCFLIGRGKDYGLIDVGMKAAANPVLANAAKAGVRPEWIHTVVLTHSHYDHSDGVATLVKKTKAGVAASPLTARALAGDPAARTRLDFGMKQTLKVRQVLREGDAVNLGPFAFRVLETPGHIPDAITLIGKVGSRTVMITGDTAIGDQGDAKGGIGWLDAKWNSKPRLYLKTIRRLVRIPADVMLPGHGNPIIGRRNVATSLRHCRERLSQFLAIQHLSGMFPLDFGE